MAYQLETPATDPGALSLDFSSLEAAYRQRRLSPAAVIDEIYRRAQHSSGDHVWTHRIPRAEARRGVLRIDAPAAKGATLPLYGLPFGLQLLGLPLSDASLLQLAGRFHATIGGKLGATAHALGGA